MLQEEEASGCKASCMVNLALLEFKAHHFSECFTWCERALKYALVSPVYNPLLLPGLVQYLVGGSRCCRAGNCSCPTSERSTLHLRNVLSPGGFLACEVCTSKALNPRWLSPYSAGSCSYQLPAGGSCGAHNPWQPLSDGTCGVGATHSLAAAYPWLIAWCVPDSCAEMLGGL